MAFHHGDLDSTPDCSASGSVGHSDYFSAKGICGLKANSLLDFRTKTWTALGLKVEPTTQGMFVLVALTYAPYWRHDTFWSDVRKVTDPPPVLYRFCVFVCMGNTKLQLQHMLILLIRIFWCG